MTIDTKNIRIIISDLDDTLLPAGSQRISQRNIDAIRNAQKKGIGFLLDTGRHYTFLQKTLFEDLPLDIISTINGACLVDHDGHTLFKKSMTMQQMNDLTEICEKNHIGLGFKFEDAVVTYANHDFFVEGYCNSPSKKGMVVNDSIEKKHHLKYGLPLGAFIIGDENIIESTVNIDGMVCAWSQKNGYDVFQKNVNKATAAQWYLKQNNLTWDNCIAFGDAGNDTCFIEKAGIGVAMGNGREQTKKAADLIADSSSNDGVAKMLEKLQLC